MSMQPISPLTTELSGFRPPVPAVKTYYTEEYKQVFREADTRRDSIGFNLPGPDGKLSTKELKEYQEKLTKKREGLENVKKLINDIFGPSSPLTQMFNQYLKRETDKIDKKLDIAGIMTNHYDRFAEKGLPYPTFAPQDLQITEKTIDDVAQTDGNRWDISARDVHGKYPPPPPPPPGPWNKFDFSTKEVQDVLKKAGTTTVGIGRIGGEYEPGTTEVTEDELKTFLKRKDITEKEAKIAQTLLDNMKEIGHQQWPMTRFGPDVDGTYPITKPKWIISNEDVDKVAKEDGNSEGLSRLDLLIKKLKEAYSEFVLLENLNLATQSIPPADPAPEPAPPPELTTEP